MSKQTTIEVTCPKCGKTHPYKIWQSINTTLDPKMKAAVRDGSAFVYTCPDCGNKPYLEYSFLYHQMEDTMMIYSATSDEDAEGMYELFTGKDPIGFYNFSEEGYLIRIVRSSHQLAEKLAIFDAGFDDRIIEIFKVYVLAMFQKGSKETFDKIETFFFTDEDGKHYVQIIGDGKPKGAARMSDESYKRICSDYGEKLKDIREEDPYVDHEWALKMMGLSDS